MSDGLLHSTVMQALNAAPDLYNTPSLAVSAAQSSDPAGTGQALVQLNQAAAVDNVVKQGQDQGDGQDQPHHWWEHVAHAIGSVPVVGSALKYAGKPLGAVQHEYRYVKDVYHNHGFWAGFGTGMSMLAVGVVAGVLTGSPAVGMLAAEGVGRLEGETLYHDSWKRTETAGGSFGRDVAHKLGFDSTDHGWGKIVSGSLDAGFDLTLDPLIKVGGINAARRSLDPFVKNYRILGRDIGTKNTAVNSFMQKALRAPGLNASNPDVVAKAWDSYRGYQRAARDIAKMKDAGAIVRHYGDEIGPLAKDLAAAKTGEDVHKVFLAASGRAQLDEQLRTGLLPTRTPLRIGAMKVADKLAGDIARKDELPVFFGRQRYLEPVKTSAGKIGTDFDGAPLAVQNASKWQPGLIFRPFQLRSAGQWDVKLTGNFARAASRKMRTFTGYMPYAIDDSLGQLSAKSIDLSDDTNLTALLRVARFGLGEKSAQQWVHDFTMLRDENGVIEPALRRRAYGELLPEILKSAGMVDDPDAVAYLTKWGRHLAAGGHHSTMFGYGRTQGDDVNMVSNLESTERYGLRYYQNDLQATLPNFRQLRTAMRDSSHYTMWYGKLDDLAAHHYTRSFFKPLALLTWGFGLRVAAAEAIPASFRYGTYNMLKGRVAATAAKLKYKLDAGEDGQIITAAAKAAGGIDKLINNEFDRELALRMVMTNEGHIARGVAAAGHSGYSRPDLAQDDVEYGIDQSAKRKKVWQGKHRTGNWRLFTPNEGTDFVEAWHYALTHSANEYSVQLTAQDLKAALDRGMSLDDAQSFATKREAQRIKGVDPETGETYEAGVDPYVGERKVLVRYSKQDPHVFAAHRVDDMTNMITGADGTLHNDLLNHFVHGDDQIKFSTLQNLDPLKRPKGVHGEVLEPFTHTNGIAAVINSGFKRVVDPTINYLSREPMYFNEMRTQWRALQPAIKAGILDEHNAFTLAQVRAVRGILPQIHNTALRSQFAMIAENLIPFYFAQEQALKRAGHLIRRNPAAFRKYQLEVHAMHDPGFIQKDQYGNAHMVIPFIGELGGAGIAAMAAMGAPILGGLPLSVTGNMASLNTVLPETTMPQWSPLVSIPVSWLANLDPAFAPAAQGVLGDRAMNEPLLSATLPNAFMRNAYKAWKGDEKDRSFANSLYNAYASAYMHGQMPDPATASALDMKKFSIRMRNLARSTTGMKAILSAFSPLSPSVDMKDAKLRDEWSNLINSDKGDYPKALATFIEHHGEKAVAFTVGHTTSTTGANLPYTKDVFNYITSHDALLHDHPWGAAFAAPQGPSRDADGLLVYNDLLETGLTERRTPEQFQQAIYVSTGMASYIKSKNAYDEAMKGLDPKSDQAKAMTSAWSDWKKNVFRLQQPVAYEHMFGPESQDHADKAYNDIVQMFNAGRSPGTEQSDNLLMLVRGYEAMRSKLAELGDGTGDRTMSSQRQAVRDAWNAYLDDTATNNPAMQNAITAVFERLEA